MSFRKNESQQISMFDSFTGLTEREQKALNQSWAKVFSEDVFPTIDEDRFSVLYSDKASRPNTPVNVIIGALVLKELFNLSDDEVVEDILLDPRFQYALHTSSFLEQPISDKTLTRFRQRCYDYEQLHGVDLYHDCVTDLGKKTAKLMGIDGRIRRMDSLMVEANIRKLSRMELIYRCISKLVVFLHKTAHDDLLEGLEHYYDPDDFNRVIYHSRSTETDDRMITLLADADILQERCGDKFQDNTEYQLLVRCLSEQTIVEEGTRHLRTKEDGQMGSGILQNPSDPDATYREKAGKHHRGYVANVEESVGENGSVITDYQFHTNNVSDSVMLKEKIDSMEQQEEQVTIITDGAYAGEDNTRMAADKNIQLITTDLPGKDVPAIVGKFELNEEETRVLKCPAGYEPLSSSFIRQTGTCTASFDRDKCANCPYQKECKAKIFKRVAKVRVTGKQVRRASLQEKMKEEEYKLYARLRNGVETIPSLLKNVYNVNRMAVRGKVKCKFCFGSKISALNFKKLLGFRRGTGKYAQNSLLTAAC